MRQVHGDKVVTINKDTDLNKIPQCDALITNEKEIPLMVMVADCIPILIYDPIKKVIAVVHAGRAGVFLKLLPKTIQTMLSEFKSKTEDLLIVLGPSICGCCYEVGAEIKNEAEKLNYKYAITHKDSSYFLDLISILKEQLKEIDIKENNIEISPYCTSCNNNLFFSYRAENNITGRFSGLLMLRDN
jgi:YfiH family protein